MTEHTKTPWAAKGQSVFDTSEHMVSLAYCGTVAGAGVCKDGKVRSFGTNEETAQANAAFIVKAINNHDALVKALEKIEYASRKDSLTEHERLVSVRTVVCEALSRCRADVGKVQQP